MPQNAELREKWPLEHEVTPPEIHEESDAAVSHVVDRARQLADIAAVVTIRTKPQNGLT